MVGIIATEVGRGLGVAMQNAAKLSPTHVGGTSGSEEAKPYTQDQVTTLLGFHGAMNVKYLMKMWRLFKMSKLPNYDHLRRAIKGEMIWWADRQQCWIEEEVYGLRSSSIWGTVPHSIPLPIRVSPSSSAEHPPLLISSTCIDRRKSGMPPREMQLTSRLSSKPRART